MWRVRRTHDFCFMRGAFMKNSDPFVTVWIFAGMLLGLAIGFAIGIPQGKVGITMCYGLVFGMGIGAGAGAAIKKLKDRE